VVTQVLAASHKKLKTIEVLWNEIPELTWLPAGNRKNEVLWNEILEIKMVPLSKTFLKYLSTLFQVAVNLRNVDQILMSRLPVDEKHSGFRFRNCQLDRTRPGSSKLPAIIEGAAIYLYGSENNVPQLTCLYPQQCWRIIFEYRYYLWCGYRPHISNQP